MKNDVDKVIDELQESARLKMAQQTMQMTFTMGSDPIVSYWPCSLPPALRTGM